MLIKRNYPVPFRISYCIGKYFSPCRIVCSLHNFVQAISVKNIISKNQRSRITINKGFTQDKRLCQSIRFKLWDVGKMTTNL